MAIGSSATSMPELGAEALTKLESSLSRMNQNVRPGAVMSALPAAASFTVASAASDDETISLGPNSA
jgi:hypothetical protein